MLSSNTENRRSVSQEKKEIDFLRNYIKQCTSIPSDSIAIRVTLSALEMELKKMDRDEKLRRKFAMEQAAVKTTNCSSDEEEGAQENRDAKRQNVDDKILVEWQDVSETVSETMGASILSDAMSKDTGSMSSLVDVTAPPIQEDYAVEGRGNGKDGATSSLDVSPLGASLAQLAISEMTDAGLLISSPIAAVALAIHSILRSSILNFKCTGIPEESNAAKKPSGGFAAPVRELRKGQFLPRGWDEFAKVSTNVCEQRVALRYRKNGFGSSVLIVSIGEGDTSIDDGLKIQVQFGASGDEGNMISFPLKRHVNDDSLNVALASAGMEQKEAGVRPALHYKALPVLVTLFCNTFDLGSITDKNADTSTMKVPLMYQAQPSLKVPPQPYSNENLGNNTRPSIPIDLRERVPNNGDFAGDLMPGGVPRPGGLPEGNLMGPGHQLFQRNVDDDDFEIGGGGGSFGFPTPGGLAMQPRFDPFYPPGVQGNRPGRGVKRGRGRGRGRFTGGDPNPDHQRPPNNLGDNMFM